MGFLFLAGRDTEHRFRVMPWNGLASMSPCRISRVSPYNYPDYSLQSNAHSGSLCAEHKRGAKAPPCCYVFILLLLFYKLFRYTFYIVADFDEVYTAGDLA